MSTIKQRTAFLFLVRDRILNPSIWFKFFSEHWDDCGIYIHSKHPYQEDLFRKFVLGTTVENEWGVLLDAELHLLRTAFQDQRNSHFALLSESCLPLQKLTTIEATLSRNPTSLIDCINAPDHSLERCPEKFPKHLFGKQSQWMVLQRRHVELILSDQIVLSMFQNAVVADEHYPVSCLRYYGKQHEIDVCQSTYVQWTHRDPCHPTTFPRELGQQDIDLFVAARKRGAFFARKFVADVQWPGLIDWITN